MSLRNQCYHIKSSNIYLVIVQEGESRKNGEERICENLEMLKMSKIFKFKKNPTNLTDPRNSLNSRKIHPK